MKCHILIYVIYKKEIKLRNSDLKILDKIIVNQILENEFIFFFTNYLIIYIMGSV